MSQYPDSVAINLDRELRQRAQALNEGQWCTSTYLEFEEALAGSADSLATQLERLHLQFENAWESYSAQPILESELTAESAVTHGLLKDGIAGWLEAIVQAGEGEHSLALERAEEANRLLVVLQLYERQLELGQ